jgi:TolB-like protein/DNA-binding SARP family transcriptional activator
MLQPSLPPKTTLLLLGRFAVRLDCGAPISILSKKGAALLAYLAMQPDYKASRERLATLLWGDRPNNLARQNLRQCLFSLRREVPEVASLLCLETESVGLISNGLAVDARDFAALAAADDPEALARASDLYIGPFVPDLGPASEEFDEWARGERARLEAAAARVLVACARQADAAGHGSRAVAFAERLVGIDPLREDWQRIALDIHARHEGRDAALAQADRLVALLKSELGVGPQPSTKALIDGIRNGESAPPTPPIRFAGGAEPETKRADEGRDLAPPPALVRHRRLRAAVAAIPTIAAVTLFSAGAWIVSRDLPSSVLPPAKVAHRPAEGPSWDSPGSKLGAPIDAALGPRGMTALMVWPFENLSGAEADQRVADGITDDLTNRLSRFQGLRVISRMTAFAWRDRSADGAQVGSDLGVRYVVEGSVRSVGNVLRINVELVEARTRLQLWTDHFERDGAERSAVQNEIVTRIARELEVGVTSAQSHASTRDGSADSNVTELLAKGMMAAARGPQEKNLKEARAYYAGALQRAPDLVPALVGVAAPEIMGSVNFIFDDRRSLGRAEALLYRAGVLDPDAPLVHYWTGVMHKARGESESALQSLHRTLELNPSYTPAYAQTGSVLTEMGRYAEAMEPIVYAMRLSPNDPNLNIWMLIAGRAELENGHYSAALEWLRRSSELAPGNPNTHLCLAATYALLGDRTNAAREVATFKRLSPGSGAPRSRAATQIADDGRSDRKLFQGIRLALAMAS